MNKIAVISVCLSVCLWGQMACADLFKAQEFTLENGLHCVVIENHKAPIVKQTVLYKVGSVDEEKGKGGSAHLLEHLMFRGTKYAKDGEFNRVMEKYGVADNAYTSHDVTGYYQFADVSKLEILLAYEADRMANLNFDEKAFEAERKIVYQERMQRVENSPTSPFYERSDAILWGNNPHGQPVTGLPEEIMALKSEDIMDFYHKYYTPSNALLILSGDITAKEARPLVEKYYGKIKSHEVKHKTHEMPKLNVYEILEMKLPKVNSIKLYDKYLLPKHSELKNKIYDYIILEEYLGGGNTSAMYKDLVLKQKKALSVGAAYSFVTRDKTIFAFEFVPQNEDEFNREETLALLRQSADEAMKNFSENKLAQIKRKMLADLVFVNDNPSTASDWAGALMVVGFTLADAQSYEDNINAVTLQGVKEAYEKLKESPRVSSVLLPLKDKKTDKGENK